MEQDYFKFSQGRFGLQCGSDENKTNLKEYKKSLRRLISHEPDSYWRQIYYLRHKRYIDDLDATVPKIVEPDLGTDYVINHNNNRFNRAQLLQSKIDRDNALLLTDIHKIYNRKFTEEENPNMKYITNREWKKRMLDSLRIGLENCQFYNRLKEIKPVVPSREYYHKWYKEMSKYRLLASKFPPYWMTRLCAPFEEVAWHRAQEIPKPIVYLDFEVLGKAVGRVAFELRADLVPMTTENFRSLCTGDRGRSYRCSEITTILNGMFWQGGDGLNSIFGETFPNENFKLNHDAEGILSMVNFGDKTSSSEYRISAAPLPPLNKKQVAFGKVIMGMSYLKNMARLAGLSERGKPIRKIIVTGCGETTEEELMNLPPPTSTQEQAITEGMIELEAKEKREKDDDVFKGGFAPIPVTRSYSDLNVANHKAEEKGTKNQTKVKGKERK